MIISSEAKTLNEVLRLTMQKRRYETKETAKEIGVSASTISRFVHGSSCAMNNIIPIARWCGLTPNELWGLLDTPEPANVALTPTS